MPAPTQSYPVSFDVTNDMVDYASVQLLRDYGSSSNAVVLLKPGETLFLTLDSGSVYRYAFKTRTRVVNVIARSWRDVHCQTSTLFTAAVGVAAAPSVQQTESHLLSTGFSVEKRWRDYRYCMSSWED
ncbi:hypothetical protein BDV98DRAFT_504244 [Pterulicium gracile]|uniref:Uncharacterized protein n=1 Tax=Pterulicium gracile TaxID=1884261 RepID=A0A5C3QNJ1_9AGAR|nr:hypothetical protein BDV98DRAFT_504244 [Pterula gracilis]